MGAKIVLAITGSIAAFKSAKLASDLVSRGDEVRCIVTRGGARFMTPLTFEALTGNPVASEVWDEQPGTSRMGHLELARWAHLLVVAPASANAIARLALGLTDDMLGSVALAARCPILLAPAMESSMWEHPATHGHVRTLRDRGVTVVGPETGRLASGATGSGRMSEPDDIARAITRVLGAGRQLDGRRVLVTAGPTYEPLDPVRFLGNRSSGKMGYAIAEEARDRGAVVTLVAGPTALPEPAGVETVKVETHEEMRQAVVSRAPEEDVIVMAAAVADFRPAQLSGSKIKRSGPLTLDLVPNSDIAAEAAAIAPRAIHVGFALESEDLVDRARDKLLRKGQNLVVANELSAEHNPFGSDRNRVVLVTSAGIRPIEETSKKDVARILWDEIAHLLAAQSSAPAPV
jgi:phosphopantothenoylcysteine decarboxylase/phosphopantothenate--cysteine ligase